MLKVLYITDGGEGGVSSHVRCLAQCLKGRVDALVCITYRTIALKVMLDEDSTPYFCCNCKNGHDIRLVFNIRKIIKEFKPDVVHFHDLPLFAALYVKMLRGVRVFSSIHTPSLVHPSLSRKLVNWAVEPCYWLPVSHEHRKNFKMCYPKARGEVFFNPVKISTRDGEWAIRNEGMFVVGMVGRNAEVKDWASYCSVVRIVRMFQMTGRMRFWGVGVSEDESKKFGEDSKVVEWKGWQLNGREWVRKMNLVLLTSKTEEMPTVVLEAFQVGTPVCGFVPEGGMEDILALSNGALKEVFVRERDCAKLAGVVRRLAEDADLRRRVVGDGWQILTNHFDAEKNVQGRLLGLYANTK